MARDVRDVLSIGRPHRLNVWNCCGCDTDIGVPFEILDPDIRIIATHVNALERDARPIR
jgi:hypothetical protein